MRRRNKSVNSEISLPKFVIGKKGGLLVSDVLAPAMQESDLKSVDNVFSSPAVTNDTPRFITGNKSGVYIVACVCGVYRTRDFKTFAHVFPVTPVTTIRIVGLTYHQYFDIFHILVCERVNSIYLHRVYTSEDGISWINEWSEPSGSATTPYDYTHITRTTCLNSYTQMAYGAFKRSTDGTIYALYRIGPTGNWNTQQLSTNAGFNIQGVGMSRNLYTIFYGVHNTNTQYLYSNTWFSANEYEENTLISDGYGRGGVMIAGNYATFIGSSSSSINLYYAGVYLATPTRTVTGITNWSNLLSCYAANGYKYILYTNSSGNVMLAHCSNSYDEYKYTSFKVGSINDIGSSATVALYHVG